MKISGGFHAGQRVTDEPDDGPRISPLVRRLELAALWKKVRTDKGWTLADVATKLGFSPAKAHRFEAGTTLPREQDVRMLFEELGQRKKIKYAVSVLDEASKSGWWERFPIHADYKRYIGLEDGAASIRINEVTWLPSIVQIPDYARALWSIWPLSDDEKHGREEVLAVRQQILERPNPPIIKIVLDENALQRPVGGADVMGRQLRHLQRMVDGGRINLRVVPVASGAHKGMQGPFILLNLPIESLPDVVYMDLPTIQLFYDDDASISEYSYRFEDLWQVSNSTVTRELLAKYIKLHEAIKGRPAHRTHPA